MSRMAVKAPRMAPATASQSLALAFASTPLIFRSQRYGILLGLAARVGGRLRRKPRPQSHDQRIIVVEGDLYRHALHNLGEIAGRVLRRQQGELRPRSRRETVDPAVEH